MVTTRQIARNVGIALLLVLALMLVAVACGDDAVSNGTYKWFTVYDGGHQFRCLGNTDQVRWCYEAPR